MLNKGLFITCLWCFCIQGGFAQATVNILEYIENRVNQLDNLPTSSYVDKNFNASWVDGMDVRTETDEFDFNRQKYLVRLSPNTPKIRKAQTNLHQLYLKKAALDQTLLRKDFIEIAYEEVLIFHDAFRKLLLQENLLVVLQDQEKVWRKLSQQSIRTPKNWMDIKAEVTQLEVDIFREEEILNAWKSEGNWINLEGLLPIDSILFYLNNDVINNRFQLQAEVYDIDNLIVEREEELEQAEQKKLLDFVQVEYRGPHDDVFKERVSLSAGFRLPFSSGRKLKMEEIAIEKEVLQQERLAEKQISKYEEKKQKETIGLLLRELQFTKRQFEKQSQEFLEIARKSSENPLMFLYQKEANIKKELEILKLETTIYEEYLDYLILTELLYQPSFYGFLSK